MFVEDLLELEGKKMDMDQSDLVIDLSLVW